MICKYMVSKYCSGNISEIENYDKAIADSTKWECHHRMEIQPDGTTLTKQWMIDHDIYFNVDPCMLIFLPVAEHRKLHHKNKEVSNETRNKIIKSQTGKKIKVSSEFGNKFFEHYGLHYIDDRKLYMRELCYYHRHNNKAKWEV